MTPLLYRVHSRRTHGDTRDDALAPASRRRIQRHREGRETAAAAAAGTGPQHWSEWLAGPLSDWSDCRHGCNGDCVVRETGSGVCTFTCHPGLTPQARER